MSGSAQYPLADIYTGIRMGVDLSVLNPGELRIVESERRLRREGGYNYVHALWWQHFVDGRTVLSIPPGTGASIRALLSSGDVLKELTAECFSRAEQSARVATVRSIVDKALDRIGLPATVRCFTDEVFVHNGGGLKIHHSGNCRKLVNSDVRGVNGVVLPEQCFPSGMVYGVIADGSVAAVAYAHKTGTMEDKVADIGVVTGPDYRQRGYAKTVVSAVTSEITSVGGEALYSCDPENEPSERTALSVGFKPYGKRFVISAE